MSADLLLRETILRALKSRDIKYNNTIHSSDFKKAIKDLGIPWGSPVIDSVMSLCLSESNGFINIKPLQQQLKREREDYNKKLQKEKEKGSINAKTSSSAANELTQSPFRVDTEANKQKLLSDRQSKLLKDYRDEVSELYKRFAHHDISIDDLINELTNLSIEPTNEFNSLIRQKQFDDISFVEFFRALTGFNTSINKNNNSNTAAGVNYSDKYKKEQEKSDFGLFNVRKRTSIIQEKRSVKQSEDDLSNSLSKLLLSNKEPVQMASATGLYAPLKSTNSKDNTLVNLKSSQNTKQSIFYDDEANISLFSSSHLAMISGTNKDKDIPNQLSYNFENKLVREQVLIALRKLQSGEISQNEFVNRLHELGFDVPDSLIVELKKMSSSGDLNYKKCVTILDTAIFKVSALNDQPNQNKINQLKSILKSSILSRGASMVLGLEKFFKDIDTDFSNTLSFQEFLIACRKLGINNRILTDVDIHIVFNDFDKNGDGELQYDEFIQSLKDELTANRRKIVRQAYQKINKKGRPSVKLSDLIFSINIAAHPQVVIGNQSPDEVLNELIEYFKLDQIDNDTEPEVSSDRFIEYYTNLSAFIPDDNYFIDSVRNTWNIGDKAPAPPTLVKHNTFGTTGSPNESSPHVIFRNSVFNTQISSGDIVTWSQEPSQFETQEELGNYRKSLVSINKQLSGDGTTTIQNGLVHRNQSSGNVYKWNNPDSHEDLKTTIKKEMKALGFNNIRGSNRSNESTVNHIEWNTKPNKSNYQIDDEYAEIVTSSPNKSNDPPVAGLSYERLRSIKPHDLSVYPLARRKSNKNQHWTKTKPFGTDEDVDTAEEITYDDVVTNSNPQSLASMINKSNKSNSSNSFNNSNKSEGKSLSDLLNSRGIN
eukprot:gene18307-23992_t